MMMMMAANMKKDNTHFNGIKIWTRPSMSNLMKKKEQIRHKDKKDDDTAKKKKKVSNL